MNMCLYNTFLYYIFSTLQVTFS